MDRLTHDSITNCKRELDSLEKIALSGELTLNQIAVCIAEISRELSGVFKRKRYDSETFQQKLKLLVRNRKHKEPKP